MEYTKSWYNTFEKYMNHKGRNQEKTVGKYRRERKKERDSYRHQKHVCREKERTNTYE